eukprot:6176679-Pleurochrysis_carterae.AAC.1
MQLHSLHWLKRKSLICAAAWPLETTRYEEGRLSPAMAVRDDHRRTEGHYRALGSGLAITPSQRSGATPRVGARGASGPSKTRMLAVIRPTAH